MDRSTSLQISDCLNQICPWTGRPVSADGLMEYRGRVVGFCGQGERDRFARAMTVFDAAIAGKTGNGE